jgi:NAD(P)-dependent dehydrogenase (short-subunit alcohol dehydrogenase family)
VTTEVYSRKLDLDNLQGERKYSWMGAYRISKLGLVLFTTELARRVRGSGVSVVLVSPVGTKTNFGNGGPSGLLGVAFSVMKHTPATKPADQAAQGIAWAATAPELSDNSSGLYMGGKEYSVEGAATDPSLAAEIWKISEHQTGIDPADSAIAAVSAADRPDA